MAPPAKLAQPSAPVQQPQRGSNWPFPPSDPKERAEIVARHRRQQRAAIIGGPRALL
jgi:hypothetical protein